MKYYLNNSYAFLQGTGDWGNNYLCPQKLYLDITEDCNLFCRMCRDKRSICDKTMSVDLFKKIVKETSPYVRSYSLFNWGEPLLVKDFCDRVIFVNQHKRRDCFVDISTNGMLLSDKMIDFLFNENVIITISVDGADKNTFENIRRGADFERIMKNAEKAAFKYRDYPIQRTPEFYISIQKGNQNSILDIVKLAYSLGIRRVGLGLVTTPDKYATIQDEVLCRELEQAYNYINEMEMFLSVYPTKVGDYVFSGERYYKAAGFTVSTVCNAPLVSAVVAYNGDVYLCCNIGDYVGNVSDSSFLALWQSQRYNILRQAVNDEENMPEMCRKCFWFNRNQQWTEGQISVTNGNILS